ncbi:hypothetical protein L6164_011838 [Bauhinia variegata]|uniref:Uncharacterized protein n=1 Tax=Bauhinia variegata TaxID=167791 RepID=A0ACB9P7B8_BAUVA|nr:hypothetical protein L6164_011838 [Bauhinia variegata]
MMHLSLYHHPGLLAAPQIEPILTGNLPPDFDSSTCRSVYVGNIHPRVTDSLLQEILSSTGPIEGCKIIRKEKDNVSASCNLHDDDLLYVVICWHPMVLFGQPIKVNWAYASSQREDTSDHYNIFVGDLTRRLQMLHFLLVFLYIQDVQMQGFCGIRKLENWSFPGFGFVSFWNQQEAQGAINDLNGKWLGNRQIRCSWATKGANNGNDDKQNSDSESVWELTNGTSEEGPEKANDDNPEMNPQYTTVYVGNLAPEVTSVQLHHLFHTLGAGTIEDVRVQRDKGFGFVIYSTHDEAALAIQIGNARVLSGKPIKCSWGSKPTPPGTASTPLPPSAAAHMPVFSAYEGQMALSKMGGAYALMHQHGQHALKQAAMGMGAPAASFGALATSQHLMYYQ